MFARLAQCFVLAAALAGGTQVQAGPTIYGTYYDETVLSVCTNQGICRTNFSQLPADKLFMVSKISCYVTSTASPGAISLNIATTLNGQALSGRKIHLPTPLSQLGSINNTTVYYTSTVYDTHYLIGQGRFPYILTELVAPSGLFSMSCTIVGDLVTPIQ